MIRAQAYDIRANRYRPTDTAVLVREVERLHGEGLRVRDIAQALRMNDADVSALLNAQGEAA